MRTTIRMSDGTYREGKTRFAAGRDVMPKASTITANPGESIGSLTLRSYGANTATNRQKLRNANASLEGTIIVPH